MVDRALAPGWLHEGLQQQPEPKPITPVLLNPSSAKQQHPRRQVLVVPLQQDEKMGIVGDQVQRSNWCRKVQLTHLSQTTHFNVAAEKLTSATQATSKQTIYQKVFPIFGRASR